MGSRLAVPKTVALIAAFTAWVAVISVCQSKDHPQERDDSGPLQLGVTGSVSSDPRQSPTRIMGSPDVQQLILEIAEEPRRGEYIEARIAEQYFTLDDMVKVGLLREEEDRYWIDFNLLLVQDQRDILDTSEELGRDLARSILGQRAEFEVLATEAGRSGHDDDLFYIVIGCFALDWDGLRFTKQNGYRAGASRNIDGHKFTPWAKEKGVTVSLEGLYWGSHNYGHGLTFTTFGDHHAVPRFGLPDLWWDSRDDFSRYSDYEEGQEAARRVAALYNKGQPWEDFGKLVRALHAGDKTSEELAVETGIDAEKIDLILDLLEIAQYVERMGDTFASRVVVLTEDDKKMVDAMVSRTRDIMAQWHETNYDSVRERLSHLTPIKCGVPFERVYTEIWHFIFAVANRTLVEEGFFADPYAEDRMYKGFLPVAWAPSLK
jgi:hypothetical protein